MSFRVEHPEPKAVDPRGAAYVLWAVHGSQLNMFDRACEAADAAVVFVRSAYVVDGCFRVRFTAYDAQDNEVTGAVIRHGQQLIGG